MRTWQADTCTELRKNTKVRPGTLAADIEAYLRAVPTMPTFSERQRHLELWRDALGAHRKRDTIKPVEIRAVLERWRAAGLSGPSCNRRIAALSNLWTVLDGRHERNPVKAVAKYAESPAQPRHLTYATLQQLLDAMPDRGQGKKAEVRSPISQTKARLRVLAYVGLPQMRIKRLKPEHVDWLQHQVWLEPRQKGAGRDGRWHPVSPSGLAALRALADAKAWGPFSNSAMWKSFRRAATAIGRPELTPYDLRHLFASTLLRVTGDTDQVRELMDHATAGTTRVYTGDAVPETLRQAMVKFEAHLADVLAPRFGEASGEGDRTLPKSKHFH